MIIVATLLVYWGVVAASEYAVTHKTGKSSNGKTTDSDSVNRGSNPCFPTSTKRARCLEWCVGDSAGEQSVLSRQGTSLRRPNMYVEKLRAWAEDQRSNHGLIDVKFFPYYLHVPGQEPVKVHQGEIPTLEEAAKAAYLLLTDETLSVDVTDQIL